MLKGLILLSTRIWTCYKTGK